MLLDFGKGNWIDKARQQPDKVLQVMDKFRSEGFISTIDSVKSNP